MTHVNRLINKIKRLEGREHLGPKGKFDLYVTQKELEYLQNVLMNELFGEILSRRIIVNEP
jgi:hypothetical protein